MDKMDERKHKMHGMKHKMHKMNKTEIAKEILKTTRYLQFQLVNANKEIDEIENSMSIIEGEDAFETKLTQFENRIEYWKGKRDTFQEIWDLRSKKELFIL